MPLAQRDFGSMQMAHVRQPVPLTDVDGVLMAHGSMTTPATKEEIESAEKKMDDYEKNEAYVKHIILSSTSPCLSSKIKNELTAKKMWDAVVTDVKNKCTLQQLDLLELLQSMRLDKGSDATTHLTKMETHFRIMEEHHDALTVVGHTVTKSNFLANVLKSVTGSYCPTVQTINTTQSKLLHLQMLLPYSYMKQGTELFWSSRESCWLCHVCWSE